MAKIKLLDTNMINMIAAGEVIERPASVVKELLENSIDAGARKITLSVEQGGRTLISVTDDGSGMDGEDLKNAFVPHATSKLASSDDLAHIRTMGFRGEALASIAAIAQLKAISRTADSIEGNCVEIDAGETINFSPASASVGTTIEIRNIFYKLPARAKFLKSANTEFSHISEQFARVALANPQLDLTLIHNGRQVYRLMADEPVRRRIATVVSEQAAGELMEISGSERGLKYYGLIGHPQNARATADYQYTFLNGRYIRDKFISHAIKEAYRGLIEPGKYPVAFLFLTMEPESFDVNVHPTKIEVRFDNSNLVHSQVLGLIREKLLSTDLESRGQIPGVAAKNLASEIPTDPRDRKERIAEAMSEFFKASRTSQREIEYPAAAGERIEYAAMDIKMPEPIQYNAPLPAGRFIQLHDSYIVAQVDEGFVIVDQHALHERTIYEELARRVSAGSLESQRLLIPEPIELSDAQVEAVENSKQTLERLGIKIEPFGAKTYIVQSFPAMLSKLSPAQFTIDILDRLAEENFKLDPERMLHEILDMAACKAAIKAGQKLTESEIRSLLENRETVERASRCPHGRPTSIVFSLSDLEKQFKRT